MYTLNSLLQRLKDEPKKTVAVAAAGDEYVLQSVRMAYDSDIADFILIGDSRVLGSAGSDFAVVHADNDVLACKYAAEMVKDGRASAIMKGLTETSTIIKAILDKETGIRGSRRLSHLAMFILDKDIYPKPLFITDAAVNISPDIQLKKEILENAVEAVIGMGLAPERAAARPKVALLAAKEKSDPKMPVTLEYDELVALNKQGWLSADLQILALDGAVSPTACRIKGIDGPVAGNADILFAPTIEVGNVLYKTLTQFVKAAVGGVILGAKAPIILTSRADSAQDKLLSIALGALLQGE